MLHQVTGWTSGSDWAHEIWDYLWVNPAGIVVNMMNYRTVFLLMMVIFSTCAPSGSDHAQLAPEKNFYFEIKTMKNSEVFTALASFLSERIPQHKYAITNRSGTTWPYYASLELDETISMDSLMPPHWYVHKMIARDSDTVLKKEDYLVRIDVMPDQDTIPNYRVEVYEMKSTGPELSATSGIHFIDSTQFSSRELFRDHYLKSIIRYSFK